MQLTQWLRHDFQTHTVAPDSIEGEESRREISGFRFSGAELRNSKLKTSLDRVRNYCIPLRFVILMAPFFGAGGPMQLCLPRLCRPGTA